MKLNHRSVVIICIYLAFSCFSTAVLASAPLWTFTPLTATTVSIPASGTATVQYQVTNQSTRAHTLVLTSIKGVAQTTSGSGVCSNPFTLSPHDSCTLSLQVNGSQAASRNTSGPVVCEQGNALQCYRPEAKDTLNITITGNQYSLGGTISGLAGTVFLQNNGVNPQPFSSNGSFTLATGLANGASYDVTVQTQPSGQICSVANDTGIINGANVTNVSVSCASDTTTLSTSIFNLALETSGNARTITITNTGSNTAENLSVIYPTWPTGTTASSNCGSTLNAGDTCTITVTPGANATSDCNAGQGSAPTPGTITVLASNIPSTVSTSVYVLTFGCIYEEGYLFAIDDTTSISTSIGGTTAALSDNSFGIAWDNGSDVITNAQSLTDGATNTSTIIAAQGSGNYAAELCTGYSIDSDGNSPCSTGACYENWYLPAICQMGASGEAAGCSSGIPNMVSNLSGLITGCTGSACLSGIYWSSTENSVSPQFTAWNEGFSSGGSSQLASLKSTTEVVRCSRGLTP